MHCIFGSVPHEVKRSFLHYPWSCFATQMEDEHSGNFSFYCLGKSPFHVPSNPSPCFSSFELQVTVRDLPDQAPHLWCSENLRRFDLCLLRTRGAIGILAEIHNELTWERDMLKREQEHDKVGAGVGGAAHPTAKQCSLYALLWPSIASLHQQREKEEAVAGDDEDAGALAAPIVTLEEVAVATGEEDEDAMLDLYWLAVASKVVQLDGFINDRLRNQSRALFFPMFDRSIFSTRFYGFIPLMLFAAYSRVFNPSRKVYKPPTFGALLSAFAYQLSPASIIQQWISRGYNNPSARIGGAPHLQKPPPRMQQMGCLLMVELLLMEYI